MAMVAETSPPPASMSYFNTPVKVTVLVQLLVCFGIIASMASITRSVVQSNVVKLNANLGLLDRPSTGQVLKSEPTSTIISNSTSESTVTSRIDEQLDYTKLHGYIVSNKERRYNSSKTVLDKLGLVAHQYFPQSYKSDTVRKAMEEFGVGDKKYLTDRFKKVFSNRMAFRDLFQQFADDPQVAPAAWRFFFEDDVALHPSLLMNPSLAQKLLTRGLEVAARDGILYLGICGPRRCETKAKVVLSSPVEAMRCAGACTHAFALTKSKTVGFLDYMDKLKTVGNINASSVYFDQLMRTYGERVHRIWILGSNLKSPQVPNHVGLVYQDRTNYPSVINRKEPIQQHD